MGEIDLEKTDDYCLAAQNEEAAKTYTSEILDKLNAMHSYIETGNALLNHILNEKLELARSCGFAGYSISIFHRAIQFCMIYVVPFAFVNYFPSQYLLRKEDMAGYPAVYLYLTPVVGIGMYLAAYGFWRYSIRFYKSSGN